MTYNVFGGTLHLAQLQLLTVSKLHDEPEFDTLHSVQQFNPPVT